MSESGALDQEVSDFQGRHALVNVISVGTYLRLMAEGNNELALAWLDSAVSFDDSVMPLRKYGAYSRTARPVLRLTLQPMSTTSAGLLRANLDVIREAVREFSSDPAGELDLEAVVWVEVSEPVAPTSEERTADIRSALVNGGEKMSALVKEFDELVGRSLLSWSSYASQRVQHLAIIDASDEELARGTALLQALERSLWNEHIELQTGTLNNISFASRAPGPALLARAAGNSKGLPSPHWRVGIIVPGGNAARSDIASVEYHPDVECDVWTVARNSSGFASRMSTAVSSMRAGSDALLIAYGGGSREDLSKVRDALAPHLETLDIPCWVAVGHASDGMSVDNELVRVCRTPSDARALFLAETIDYERKMRIELASAAHDLASGRRQVRTRDSIVDRLAALDKEVQNAREQHLQEKRA